MKLETTAQILTDVNRVAKSYEEALAHGDRARAGEAAGKCVTGYRRLSEKVPLRGLFYIGKAKEWEKKLADAEEDVRRRLAGHEEERGRLPALALMARSAIHARTRWTEHCRWLVALPS